jgi:hypothetical protein
VQVDPIKPTLKASGAKRLKLKYDEPLSNVAFEFNLRRYSKVENSGHYIDPSATTAGGRGLPSFTFPLNLSLLCPSPLNFS